MDVRTVSTIEWVSTIDIKSTTHKPSKVLQGQSRLVVRRGSFEGEIGYFRGRSGLEHAVSVIERIAKRGDDFAIPALAEHISRRDVDATWWRDPTSYISRRDVETEINIILDVLLQIASRGNETVTRLFLARLGTSSKDLDLIKGLAQVANRGDQDVIRALLKVLRDNIPSAAERFLARNSPTCFACFEYKYLHNRPRGFVRRTVLETLTEIAEPGGEIAPILVEALVDRLNNDEDPWVRKAAIGTLEKAADQDFFVATLQSRLYLSRETDREVEKVVLRALQAQVATDPQ